MFSRRVRFRDRINGNIDATVGVVGPCRRQTSGKRHIAALIQVGSGIPSVALLFRDMD